MDSDNEISAPMDLDDAPEKTSDTSSTNQTTTGSEMDSSSSSLDSTRNDSKTSDLQSSTNQTTPGKKNTTQPFDKTMIRRIYECRYCDFKDEDLSKVSVHVELHKRPGPSNKPAFFPQYGIVNVPKEAAPTGLVLPDNAEK